LYYKLLIKGNNVREGDARERSEHEHVDLVAMLNDGWRIT